MASGDFIGTGTISGEVNPREEPEITLSNTLHRDPGLEAACLKLPKTARSPLRWGMDRCWRTWRMVMRLSWKAGVLVMTENRCCPLENAGVESSRPYGSRARNILELHEQDVLRHNKWN